MINNIFTDYYRRIRTARKNNQRVAWTSIGFPKNLLYAMNIVPAYPQLHVGFQASKGLTGQILGDVEGKYEIPHDLCGEVKSMIGTIINGDRLSFTLPEPHLLAATNCACSAQVKGFNFLHHYLKIPLFFSDYPCVSNDPTDPHVLAYVKGQLAEIVRSIEKRFGARFDEQLYYRSTINDFKAYTVWLEIMKLFKNRPVPADAIDLYLFLVPFFCMDSGRDAFIDLYIMLYNALYERCRNQESPPKREIRLLWDTLPVNHKNQFFKKIFSRYGAAVVMSTYFSDSATPKTTPLKFSYPLTRELVEDAVQKEPFEEIEPKINHILGSVNHRAIAHRKGLIKKIIETYDIDGVIMHLDRSCRVVCLPQYELTHFVETELKIPVLVFDSNSMDERFFAESQVLTRIEAFMERLRS